MPHSRRFVSQASQHECTISRRTFMTSALAAASSAVLFGLPQLARGADATEETKNNLADAQARYQQAQDQLNSLTAQFEDLTSQLDETMSKIEGVQDQIDETQKQIDQTQAELEERQNYLSQRVASSYKNGGISALSLLFSSSSFEDLISNAHYLNRVNTHDQQAISEVQEIQQQLANQKADLETQKSDFEKLKTQQASSLDDMKAKKAEVQTLLTNLDSEVKDLMEKRDAEIFAAAQAEEQARRLAQSQGTTSIPGDGQESIAAGTAQQRIVDAAKITPSPGVGLCAAWVSYVFQNAGFGHVWGNADDMYVNWCTSSRKEELKVGMIIAVPSHPHTAAGAIYGHVGVYVGDNTVMDNIGYIRSINVDSWIAYYGITSTPRWGWANGIDLEG